MKKTLFTLTFLAMVGSICTVHAQEDQDRAARRQQNQERQTERLIKDLNLNEEQTTQFKEIYTRYLTEIEATRQQTTEEKTEKSSTKKELTDAEATAKLTEYFTRQETLLQQQQQRLDIQKKYLAEFSSVLTPAQILKVIQPQRNRNGNGNGGNRGSYGGGEGFQGGGGPGGYGGGGGFGGPGGGF